MVTVGLLKGFAWAFLIFGTLFSVIYPIELTGSFNLLYAVSGFISSLFAWTIISGFTIIVENNIEK
jgi:hypothetical protein